MSKFFRRIMLAIMFSIILVGTLHAETLIVGVDANFRPFEFKNEQGEFTGFDVQLWDAIANGKQWILTVLFQHCNPKVLMQRLPE
jgi:glutamine transport system substrate-binding protein